MALTSFLCSMYPGGQVWGTAATTALLVGAKQTDECLEQRSQKTHPQSAGCRVVKLATLP